MITVQNRQRVLREQLRKRQDILRTRLDELLTERGWKTNVLAERAGVSASAVYNFTSGTTKMGMPTFKAIAEAFDVSEEYLLMLSSDRARKSAELHRRAESIDPKDQEIDEIVSTLNELNAEDVARIRLLVETFRHPNIEETFRSAPKITKTRQPKK